MANEIIEGVSQKNAMLWRYATNLKNHCVGNTMKIDMKRPLPSIPPTLGKFYFVLMAVRRDLLKFVGFFIGLDGCHRKRK